MPQFPLSVLDPLAPTIGVEPVPIEDAQGSFTPVTQVIRLGFFKPRIARTVSNVRTGTGGVAAAATPTLIRFGLWTTANADGTGALTLARSTANDTSLFAATLTDYPKALNAAITLDPALVYAYGWLFVGAGVLPSLACNVAGFAQLALGGSGRYRKSAQVTGQTDIPASVASGSVVLSTTRPYVYLY